MRLASNGTQSMQQ